MANADSREAILGNRLVDAQPDRERQRLALACERIDVAAGDILFEAGANVTRAHLPAGPTLVSFLVELDDGASVEMVLVGLEGAVGGIVSGGFLPAFSRTPVQYPGPMASLPLKQLESLERVSF